MSDTASRAEAARKKILESGNPDLIGRLHLLEATAASGPARPQPSGGPGLLGMGLAVAGGAWLGSVLGGLTLSGEMQRAFSEVAEGMGLDPADIAAIDAADIDASGDGIFDDFGGFFDL
ncbi:hypothetical protein [Rhodobaculum claviforme]|uniref:Uncharacterized protein n=1 Tax=Rhodobaculum claviforme TaxID=1549854 RepID=A0A934WJ43_9RHOB|nr:hypothetical protein [Rhodobaculum claviforme]MBK5928785.1 hypothetical protein [Rhodobaculum claviforme]